jgi:hypothetical protein
MNEFIKFFITGVVFVLAFLFGYLMHAMSVEIVHDNQLESLRAEISVQEGQLEKCAAAARNAAGILNGSVPNPAGTNPPPANAPVRR